MGVTSLRRLAKRPTHAYDALTRMYDGSVQHAPLPYKFTGKERDSESGLDNFGARYDSSSMGRFMTPDPIVITTERLYDPQQLNAYSYVRNNPTRLVDPTGMILQLSGDAAAARADLCQIVGADNCSRISVDEKTGVVTFDTKDLDLGANAGAALVNDLAQSKSTYDFSEGPTVQTAGGTIKVDYIRNLPLFGDQVSNRKCNCAADNEKPKTGVDDQVAFNPNNPKITLTSFIKSQLAVPYTVAFHELAEAYEKIDGGKGGTYAAGHNAAIQREDKLRDQRPYLKDHNPGSGGPANSGGDHSIMIRK